MAYEAVEWYDARTDDEHLFTFVVALEKTKDMILCLHPKYRVSLFT